MLSHYSSPHSVSIVLLWYHKSVTTVAAGRYYQYQLSGQHAAACVQELAHSYSQGIQGHRPVRKVLDGQVLRHQAVPHL